jgi:hypothetical protein
MDVDRGHMKGTNWANFAISLLGMLQEYSADSRMSGFCMNTCNFKNNSLVECSHDILTHTNRGKIAGVPLYPNCDVALHTPYDSKATQRRRITLFRLA